MSEFYNKKFYNRKGNDSRFYIPLHNVKIDLSLLIKEVYSIFNLINPGNYGITTSTSYINEVPYNFERYSGISLPDQNGERVLSTGERDEEIIHWPVGLENSYMKQLGEMFSELIGIKNPRVRLSSGSTIEYHSDPHTPYRIHIALEARPYILWNFRTADGIEHPIYQAADGIPVLIETGITEHSIICINNKLPFRRVHLWYQFHDIISDDILSKF